MYWSVYLSAREALCALIRLSSSSTPSCLSSLHGIGSGKAPRRWARRVRTLRAPSSPPCSPCPISSWIRAFGRSPYSLYLYLYVLHLYIYKESSGKLEPHFHFSGNASQVLCRFRLAFPVSKTALNTLSRYTDARVRAMYMCIRVSCIRGTVPSAPAPPPPRLREPHRAR